MQNRTNIRKNGFKVRFSFIVYQQYDVSELPIIYSDIVNVHRWSPITYESWNMSNFTLFK